MFNDDGSGPVIASVVAPISGPCRVDMNADGTLNFFDISTWINAFNNNLPQCDQNDDGNCDPSDFTAWINNFNNGC